MPQKVQTQEMDIWDLIFGEKILVLDSAEFKLRVKNQHLIFRMENPSLKIHFAGLGYL